MNLDPPTLNYVATALVLAAVGYVLGAEYGHRIPGFAYPAILATSFGVLALLIAGARVEPWTAAFFTVFAWGWMIAEKPQRTPRAERFRGFVAAAVYAGVAILAATLHRWWFAPVALLAALAVGLLRQVIAAAREARAQRSAANHVPSETSREE